MPVSSIIAVTMKPPSTSAYNTVASEETNDTKSKVILQATPISIKESSDSTIGGETWSKGELQPLAYRDKKFAIAFLVHMLGNNVRATGLEL
jgi:hypothetical protein